MRFIPSWDGLSWVTNIDSYIRSLKKIIIICIISFFETNKELADWLLTNFETLKL